MGVAGEAVFAAVTERLGRGGFRSALIRATSLAMTSGFMRQFGQAAPTASRRARRFKSTSFRPLGERAGR
jgi:hypothetical protein